MFISLSFVAKPHRNTFNANRSFDFIRCSKVTIIFFCCCLQLLFVLLYFASARTPHTHRACTPCMCFEKRGWEEGARERGMCAFLHFLYRVFLFLRFLACFFPVYLCVCVCHILCHHHYTILFVLCHLENVLMKFKVVQELRIGILFISFHSTLRPLRTLSLSLLCVLSFVGI